MNTPPKDPPANPSKQELVALANQRLMDIQDLRHKLRVSTSKIQSLENQIGELVARSGQNSAVKFPPFVKHRIEVERPFDLAFKIGFGLLLAGVAFWFFVVVTFLLAPAVMFAGAAAGG